MDIKKTALSIGSLAIATIGIVAAFKNPSQYSDRWIKSLTDDELRDEREIVRKKYCTTENSYENSQLQRLLGRFDAESHRRYQLEHANDPQTPHIYWTDANRWERD